MPAPAHFVVAGHLCLDLVPVLSGGWPQPGGLVEAGLLHASTGGAVANVGFALWRLGCQVRLVGLVGNDWMSQILTRLLQPLGEQPGIRIAPGQATSYSIVMATEGCDRAFLHCAGANTAFTSADVRDHDLDGAAWLHFGYPPLMPAIAAHGGQELAHLLCRATERGLRTSLDFCSISSTSAATDWRAVLRNCARYVTVFAPSIEELRAALRQPSRPAGDIGDVGPLSKMLLAMGFAIVMVKLGTSGLYLATTCIAEDLARWQLGREWRARELWAPCFRADFVNASGAGDCTIAGLIAAITGGSSPEQALTIAIAAGASSVEAADASSGVRSMAELQARVRSGWERLRTGPPGDGWIYDPPAGVWRRSAG